MRMNFAGQGGGMELIMTGYDIKRILDCEVVAGEEYLTKEIHTACGSDMMSDVLAFVKDQSCLLYTSRCV